MITVKLHGGLGNQLFQYAFALKLARELKKPVDFETCFYTYPPKGATIRSLDIYDLVFDINITNKPNVFRFLSSKFARGLNINLPSFLRVIEKDSYIFDGFNFSNEKNYYLYGYWQSLKYMDVFKENYPDSNIFPDFNSVEKSISDEMKKSNSVAVHVRRGDLISSEVIQKKHGVCDIEYYLKSMEHISKDVDSPVFYMFSDDIPWCKSNFSNVSGVNFIESDCNTPPWRDMALMAACKNNIIANSTYSWWGAWLNPNDEKIVIVPKFWAESKVGKNLVPGEWVLI